MSYIFALIKFGDAKHIRQLQEDGLMWFNTLEYYQSIEDENLRGDQYEGTHSVHQAPEVQVTIGPASNTHTIDSSTGLTDIVTINMDEGVRTNVYCMTAISDKTFGPIDPSNFRFGDSFLALTNGVQFIERVKSAIQKNALDFRHRLVEYVDRSTYSGEMGPFRKFNQFSYQSEYRFVLDPKFGKPYQLRIGSIKDISIVGQASEINDVLSIKYRDDYIHKGKNSLAAT